MVHGTRRNAKKMRNLRCKSTDSRITCTLNKNLLQQHVVQSSRFEFNGTGVNMFSLPVRIPRTKTIDDFVRSLSNLLPENPSLTTNSYSNDCQSTTNNNISRQAVKGVGLEEEHLDFEPEYGEELTDDAEEQSQLPVNSDESTVRLCYSNDRDGDSFTNASLDNYSISTVSVGHRREMLQLPESNAEDGRQNEYLPFTYASTTRTLLDSSSDDASDGSESYENAGNASEENRSEGRNFDNSGTVNNDDDDSAWDITQEEEDKLLDSSEDDTDEYGSVAETEELVVTCQIGNARITLPKFTNDIHIETLRGNDLKRTNSTARPHMTRNKKKKWDLRYTPEVPPTRVFLDDIGFVSDCGTDDDNRDTVDSNSLESVRQLIVFCNDNEKVVCQTNKREFHREISTPPKGEDGLFKLPLPPPKRPPTRPKRTVCNSEDFGKNLQIKVSNKDILFEPRQESSFDATNDYVSRNSPDFQEEENSRKFDIADKDDTISIIASTIGGENIEETSNLSHSGSRGSASFEFAQMTRNKTASPGHISYDEKRTQNWVQNVPDPDPLLLDQQEEEESELPQIKNNIALMPPVSPKGNTRVYFGDVPTVFMGLCYFHYFNGKCLRHCKLMHSVHKGKYLSKFKHKTPEELTKAYDFSLGFEMFFKEIYPCFIQTFGTLKMQKKLVTCIEDIFKISSIDKTEALDVIVKSLEDSGLSFLDTIEIISFNVGFLQYPELGDILLDLITRKHNISENWDVIKRIGRAIGQISPAIVKRMLNRVTSVYPLDKQLCLEIYNVIIKNKMTDLSQISEDYLAPLRTLAGFRDMTDMTTKQTVTVVPPASIIHPPTIPNKTELLAARIDNNLMKEREWYEREVEGRTVRTTILPNMVQEPRGPYFSSYDYKSRNATVNYDNFRQSSDSDDRFFVPQSIQDVFLSRNLAVQNPSFSNSVLMGTDKFSTPASSVSNEVVERSTSSRGSGLRFEPPPEISQYVPETVRKIALSTNSPKKSNSVLFQSPSTLPQFRHQDLDITLTPSRPIFGCPRYRNDFKLDRSLHNLLPDTIEHVNINERDIAKLDGVIKTKNGPEFYRLLEQYKSPPTLQNFITMTIAHLKSCNELYEVLLGLVESVESIKPDYHKDKYLKAVLEVVVMNLLFEFERKGFWYKAGKLLEKFCDWDSLISSQIFAMRRVTIMGRYIFLAKIFAKSQNFHQTYEILQCPSLHLLESCDHWPAFYNAQADLEQRNVILTDFFKHGYRYSIVDVSDMYRRIYKYGSIHGYDAHCLFNPMLITIMNEHKISLLKHFYPDIDVYYKIMDKNVLRAFTILLSNQLTEEELFILYELCCERQIYTYFQGGETNITVRNNMMDVELQLILKYYFYKISKTKHLPTGDVIINIKLLESQVCSPKILQKCCRSIKEINDRIKEILRDDFNIFVNNTVNSKPTIIEINLVQIENWLRGKEIYCHQSYW